MDARTERLMAIDTCPCCGQRPLVEGRRQCKVCLDSDKQRRQRYRKERAAAGVCNVCGREPVNSGGKRCARCGEKNRGRLKKAKDLRLQAGMCARCGCEELVTKRFCMPCYDMHKACGRRSRQKLKMEVFEAYGGCVCKCCGEKESSFLSMDHVNGGGQKHLKKIGTGRLYYWLRDNDFPSGFQVLCMNCQFGRKNNRGVCPHQRAENERRA